MRKISLGQLRKAYKCLLGAVLVALGVSSALGWQYATDRGKPTSKETRPSTSSPELSGGWVEGIGYVEPRTELRRLAFKTGGVISRCGPKPGDRARKGEVIAELDDAAAKVAVEGARRKLDHARAKLCDIKAGEHPHLILLCERSVDRLREQARHMRVEANRLEKTRTMGVGSDAERNEAVTKAAQAEIALREKEAELLYLKNKVRVEQVAVAEAEVRLAEAEVAEAEQRLADTRLTVPFDGVVLKYLKREGEGVSPLMPPEPVVLFGDMAKFRVRAEIDERYARLLTTGQAAEVYGRNVEGRVYPGRVVEVEQVMGDKTLFSRSASERKDLHVLQVVVEMGDEFNAPVGLQVDVRVKRE